MTQILIIENKATGRLIGTLVKTAESVIRQPDVAALHFETEAEAVKYIEGCGLVTSNYIIREETPSDSSESTAPTRARSSSPDSAQS